MNSNGQNLEATHWEVILRIQTRGCVVVVAAAVGGDGNAFVAELGLRGYKVGGIRNHSHHLGVHN